MKLKNRLTTLVAVAAIAVPALAFAAAKYSKADGKGSVVNIKGFAPGVSFVAVAKDNGINVKDDGTTITVSVDGHKLKTGMDLRDEHMRKQLFANGHTIALSVTHADLEAGLKSHKVKGSLKFSDKPATSVTVEGVSLKDGAVTGHFKTTRSALKIPEACMPPVNVPCVKDDLEVDATIYVKE